MEKKKKIHDSFNIELLQHFFDKSLKIAEDLPSLMWPKVNKMLLEFAFIIKY